MSSDFIDTIKRAIAGRYHLRGGERKWILEEGEPPTEIHVPNKAAAIAFSLDRPDPKPFAFFSCSPPRDFAKMCDAILFCFHENKTYLFLTEVKTGNEGDCDKQLVNGKLFCDWLIALCSQHKSLNPHVIVVPLLVWKPRHNSVHKGTTTHRGNSDGTEDGIEKKSFGEFDGCGFEIRNKPTVQIFKLIKYLEHTMI